MAAPENALEAILKGINIQKKIPASFIAMKLQIDDEYYFSEITPADKPAYIEHFSEPAVFTNMHQIPYPYTDKDADWFINKVAEEKAKCGRSLIWAIRRSDGYLIGGLAFNNLIVGQSHQSSIGYWLAKPYWGRGIMTRAVRVAVQFAFKEFEIVRLYAEVRDINSGSAKVLLNAGFVQEGLCRKLWRKGADFWDCKIFALVV